MQPALTGTLRHNKWRITLLFKLIKYSHQAPINSQNDSEAKTICHSIEGEYLADVGNGPALVPLWNISLVQT